MDNWKNKLFYGDNLDVMRKHVDDNSIDLIYLDPPFKSDLNYNVLYKADGLSPDEAQWTAFKDTWFWDTAAERIFSEELQNVPNPELVGYLNALEVSLQRTPMFAYLVNMAIRLLELHKKLKPTGSIYLHCDPNASHYLKVLMDFIFSPLNFRSEIVWRRSASHNKLSRQYGPIHDTILFYSKTNRMYFEPGRTPYVTSYVNNHFTNSDKRGPYRTNEITGSGTRGGESGTEWRGYNPTSRGRHWAISGSLKELLPDYGAGMSLLQMLDALAELGEIDFSSSGRPTYRQRLGKGVPYQDIWAYQPGTAGLLQGTNEAFDQDVKWLDNEEEKLGYPTQKPVGLLKRIILSSSKVGDLVLDPFAGCGTTIAAAQAMDRRWIGIDISPFAIELIRKQRLERIFTNLTDSQNYIIDGLPTSMDGAKELAERDKKGFEIWAVSQLDGIPNEKKGADRGIDGRIPFKPDGRTTKYAVISVKGGKLKADDIRSLNDVAKREKRSSLGFGVFVTLNKPTKGMRADAAAAGVEVINNQTYSRTQILTIEDILRGIKPNLPFIDTSAGYRKAPLIENESQQDLLDWENE